MIRTILCSAVLALVATGALAGDPAARTDKELGRNVTLVYDQPLPNVPGKSMRGVLVKYEPGGNSPAHLHPRSAFIYATVLEGAIRSKVNDEPEVTYRAGESWSEFPGDRHAVSANASATEPARLLAVFVVDTGETELVTPYEE
ncbi:MAG TPA: cupin domain-containing protein [Rhizobiaceae bacterium]